MKKISIIAAAALMLASVMSCNREMVNAPEAELDGVKYLTELNASLDDLTKTGLNTSTGIVSWSTNDRIAVIGTDKAIHQYKLEEGAGTAIGRFLPYEGDAAPYSDITDLTAVYPVEAASVDGSGNISITINQKDLTEDQRDTYGITTWNKNTPFSFTRNDIKVAKPANNTLTADGVNFKFQQLGTWCTFSLDFTGSDEDYSRETVTKAIIRTADNKGINGKAALSGTTLGAGNSTSIEWEFNSPLAIKNVTSFSCMMFPQVLSSSEMQIVLETNLHTFTFYAHPSQNFAAGTTLSFPIQVDKNFSSLGTAERHYTVEEKEFLPFYYYGGTNTLLLADGATDGSLSVKQYRTNAYYENVKLDVKAGDAKPAASAKVLWRESGLTIADSNLSISSETLNVSGVSGSGNAVVAIYDSSDNLLWSYLIWKPVDTINLLDYTKTASGSYKVMSMPIGATKNLTAASSDADKIAGAGLYFQWGRKDPLGRNAAVASNTLITPAVGSLPNKAQSEVLADYTGDVADEDNPETYKSMDRFMIDYTVSHPNEFIVVADGVNNNDWAGVTNNNLWGNSSASGTYPKMAKTYKSIFDPSPAGYRVAPQDLWLNFTSTKANSSDKTTFNVVGNESWDGSGTFTRGWTFYYQASASGVTDYYYASGYRNRTSGALNSVGSSGYYWSSAPSGANASFLCFSASSVYPLDGSNRAYGFPVRCVQE